MSSAGARSAAVRPTHEKHVVGRVRDLPDGTRMIVTVAGRSVGIFNVEGRYYALLNRCPHNGAELCKGEVVGVIESDRPGDWRLDDGRKLVACPWHGWEYDLVTGESWFNPSRTRARPYELSIEGGEEVVKELADGSAGTDGSAALVDALTHRVKGPFTAEVLPIAVEDDYLVLSLRSVNATPERGGPHAA